MEIAHELELSTESKFPGVTVRSRSEAVRSSVDDSPAGFIRARAAIPQTGRIIWEVVYDKVSERGGGWGGGWGICRLATLTSLMNPTERVTFGKTGGCNREAARLQ